MNINGQEKSQNSLLGEIFDSDENNISHGEYLQWDKERYFHKEKLECNEIAELSYQVKGEKQTPKEQDLSKNLKKLTRFFSTAVVTVTAGAMLVVPIFNGAKKLKLNSEDVGFNSYYCVLDAKDMESELQAVITNDRGEKHTISISSDNQEYFLYFDDLAPETEYDLTVISNEGKELYEDSFITEPFIELKENENGKTHFFFHEDVSLVNDFILRMYSEDGRDFTSNLIYDDLYDVTQNYIALDGLYAGRYVISLEIFFAQEERSVVYEKSIQFGGLTSPSYIAAYQKGDSPDTASVVNLSYLSGDVAPYTVGEVTLVNKQTEQWHFYNELIVDGTNNISVTITEELASGIYQVIINGIIENEEVSLFNQLWIGEIII